MGSPESGIAGARRRRASVLVLSACLAAFAAFAAPAGRETMVTVPGGDHRDPFRPDSLGAVTRVKPFRLDIRPVTVAEFQAFVRERPEWRRDRVKRVFADSTYLADWPAADGPPPGAGGRAVTRVPWNRVATSPERCSFGTAASTATWRLVRGTRRSRATVGTRSTETPYRWPNSASQGTRPR